MVLTSRRERLYNYSWFAATVNDSIPDLLQEKREEDESSERRVRREPDANNDQILEESAAKVCE